MKLLKKPIGAQAGGLQSFVVWRMDAPCADCPFNKTGAGAHLRRTLRPARWREILSALRRDGHFFCHKTTRQTGNGSELLCAGAIAWQDQRGLDSQYRRICERVAASRGQ